MCITSHIVPIIPPASHLARCDQPPPRLRDTAHQTPDNASLSNVTISDPRIMRLTPGHRRTRITDITVLITLHCLKIF